MSVKPEKGMIFTFLDEAEAFYYEYAKQSGFTVRKGSQYELGGIVKGKHFLCSKEGNKPFKKYDSSSVFGKGKKKVKHRKKYSTRTGCNGHIVYTSSNGRSYKVTKYGGFEKVGVTVVECKNFKRDLNCYIGEYDAEIVVRRMLNKKDLLTDYSFEYTVDDEGKLTAMFWADGECKANYQAFGEIVSFDATFNTNKYKMGFVPFIGIDNHFHNSFGCQLKVVVTDQDRAMKIAIENVFDQCRHRLCMWHIMKKVADKVGPALCNNDKFKEAMCSIVWTDSIDPEFFNAEWQKNINDYDLASNKWLYEMFEIRGMWIPAYFRDEWMSGLMRTTPRSESENHFFSQVTNSQMTLLEFFLTIMKLHLRFKDKPIKRMIMTPDTLFPTCGMNFQLRNKLHAYTQDHAAIRPGCWRIDGDITCTCSCKRFELYGLLCSHVFYVLTMFEVLEIPQKYIMKRCTKEAAPNKGKKALPLSSDSNFANAHEVDKVLRDIMSSYEYIINRLSPDLEALCSVRDQMKEMAKKVDEENRPVVPKNHRDRFAEILRANQPVDGIKNKGRGSHKRIKSKKEQASNCAGKRSRKCLVCGLLTMIEGHVKVKKLVQMMRMVNSRCSCVIL
ncbi:hypothetical protein SSX86_004169 [Deinandra increscens subsp. villosa]|uniref:SWIM-type domain-containing protein n=1 Tax=Deinandra increscens subsp. villosa TaxID=3103831 RepID=A0AAP0HAN8_9ASTR